MLLFLWVSADLYVVLQLGLGAARPQGGHDSVVELQKKTNDGKLTRFIMRKKYEVDFEWSLIYFIKANQF